MIRCSGIDRKAFPDLGHARELFPQFLHQAQGLVLVLLLVVAGAEDKLVQKLSAVALLSPLPPPPKSASYWSAQLSCDNVRIPLGTSAIFSSMNFKGGFSFWSSLKLRMKSSQRLSLLSPLPPLPTKREIDGGC